MTTPSVPRRLAGDPLLAAAAGGAVIAAIELVTIGAPRPGLVATLLALFAATGALAGAVQLATGWLVRRLRWQGVRAAAVHALPSLAIWIPVCATLFEGAFAATLPGAAVAPYALPVVLTAGVAVAIRLAAWWRARPGRRDPAIAAALVAALAVTWLANHRLFRSGYPDLHVGLTLVEIVLAGLAIRVGGDGALPRRARAAVAALVALAAAAALVTGLEPASDRRTIATRGDDTRHLVRLWRSVIDLDRDGTSAILGGGDCDDLDPARHPGARDVPGNGRDEDCDGADTVVRAPSPEAEAQAASLAEWRARPEVAAALARTAPMNVLVISIDTLRADTINAGAPGRAEFPRLAALVDGAVAFPHAYAPAAGTDVSLTTFVTGRWNPFQPIDTTLIEAMAGTGRATGVIFPREVLRYVPEPLLTRGAGSVERIVTDGAKRDVGDRVSSGEITDKALAFLDGAGDRPWFLWAHYFDPHEHEQLAPPAELLAKVGDGGLGTTGHRYRALVRAVDDEVGRLLDELARRGLADRTIVVLFSDHGESLGEDVRLPDNHGVVVYNALTHVPVAIHVPGVAPAAAPEAVSLIDLTPTLLALAGAPGAMAPLDGLDLTPALLGAPPALRAVDRALVSNESEQWAVIAWPWKLLVRPADNLTELYDLSADPGERQDVAADHPDVVRDLRGRYGAFPAVPLDRTRAGRRWREAQARPPTARGK